jgi:hypothetical protein
MAKTSVIYKGPGHIRILGKADLKKAGVEEFPDTTFERGIPQVVSAGAAKALVEHSRLFGNFILLPSEKTTEATSSKAKDNDGLEEDEPKASAPVAKKIPRIDQ